SLSAGSLKEKELYQSQLASAMKKQQAIDARLSQIREGREKLEATYKTIGAGTDAGQAVRKMYEWLLSHRNLKTGLVASYEGDSRLDDWAFTYDQALVCQTFLAFRDRAHAAEILEFFSSRAPAENGAFFNAYDTVDGTPKENVVRAGPNIWLGIAALQYEHQTKDGRFLPLARRIGEWVLSQQDTEGGVKGGPSVMWYSTEHNLDAYAFYAMLYRETRDKQFAEARDASLKWIKKYAYSLKERRMNRGKGDSTIATDTFSWAVAAMGPGTLKEIQFDPEEIMSFAEKNTRVTVSFVQPNGKAAKATGFDFARSQNLGRGGVISTEWTAQVVVTYQILSRWFEISGEADRAALYREKANFYLNELQKLIITSPSRTGQGRGCLPYASTDDVDTGHGWRTPQGKRTGSVAGTAYGIFAWIGYNPFDLDNQPRIPL
ncbi:MAG TPA: hypothetical protein VL404_03285, partial [Candidatus Eisenbacteria bacterium]|nr:hypothetical protein [Candidatus Eisenbacteria bacterium]